MSPARLASRQDLNQNLPGGLPGNTGTIAWAVGLSLLVIISVPAFLIWRRRRKVVKAQMAKTAEGAAAWRAHRAREREEANTRHQRFQWHRADRAADRDAAAHQADEESVPNYEARGTGDGRPPAYDDLEMQALPPAHVREYYAGSGGNEPRNHAPAHVRSHSANLPPPPPRAATAMSTRSLALQPGTSSTDQHTAANTSTDHLPHTTAASAPTTTPAA